MQGGMKKLLVLGLVFLIPLLLTGCGNSGETGSSVAKPQQDPAAERPTSPPPERADPREWASLRRVAGRYADRLVIPSGPAPKRVVTRDLKQGEGPVLQRGDSFLVRYVSWVYGEGWASETYWRPPVEKTWGMGIQIEGWEVGLEGMRIGGIRELIVPAPMAYEATARVYLVQPVRLS
jgi:peptidylprolyl isomerase